MILKSNGFGNNCFWEQPPTFSLHSWTSDDLYLFSFYFLNKRLLFSPFILCICSIPYNIILLCIVTLYCIIILQYSGNGDIVTVCKDGLSYTRYCSKSFKYIITINSHNYYLKEVELSSPFYFFNNIFIEIQFTYHTVGPIKVCDSIFFFLSKL